MNTRVVALLASAVLASACGKEAVPRAATVEAGVDAGSASPGTGTDAAPSGGGGAASDPALVGCGPTSCAPGGIVAQTCCIEDAVYTCRAPADACNGHRLGCDETADCPGAVCCAEHDGDRLVTACRTSCVTGVPRWQVCKSDAECESHTCRVYTCGPNLPPLRTCEAPDGCQLAQ